MVTFEVISSRYPDSGTKVTVLRTSTPQRVTYLKFLPHVDLVHNVFFVLYFGVCARARARARVCVCVCVCVFCMFPPFQDSYKAVVMVTFCCYF